ncbi:enoyl-CoA hydratase-related protein [Alphaproteobacteria bacterium]|nr:enoyl-CoA hydratase-related protein [Alphaproteobacteria bacterium]
MTDLILQSLDDNGVLTITLNRPNVLNSLNRPIIEDLIKAFNDASTNSEVRVVVLTGSGRGFCAGADLLDGQWPREPGWSAGQGTAYAMKVGFNPLVRAITGCDKPVLTAINGMAAGGGVGLALCGDLVIAAQSAKFKLVFGPQLGIIPDVGASWLVPRLIGRSRANGLGLLGDNLDAETAADWGMVWECVSDENLMPRAQELAMRMADSAISGLKAVSRAHDHALDVSLDEQLDYEVEKQEFYCDQPEFAEGVKAFASKRKPDFRGLKK